MVVEKLVLLLLAIINTVKNKFNLQIHIKDKRLIVIQHIVIKRNRKAEQNISTGIDKKVIKLPSQK